MSSAHAAFLFGSGISFASGAPTVQQMTARLLSAAWRRNNGQYVPAKHRSEMDRGSLRVQEFLRRLNSFLSERSLLAGGRPTYEDLFSATLQLDSYRTFDRANPIIHDFAVRLLEAVDDLLVPRRDRPRAFSLLLRDSARFIQWVVYHSLATVRTPRGLSVLSEAAQMLGQLDIFTLNHDLLVEEEMIRTGTEYSDGFYGSDGQLRCYSGGWSNCVVQVFKLHGSINLYLDTTNGYHHYIRPVTFDIRKPIKSDGTSIDLCDYGEPLFLTGTGVKEQSYGTLLIGNVLTEFRKRLSGYAKLVVCGYGWMDRGINDRLEEWLSGYHPRELVILHNDPMRDIRNTHFWESRWDEYAHRVQVVSRWLSECSLADLIPFFESSDDESLNPDRFDKNESDGADERF